MKNISQNGNLPQVSRGEYKKYLKPPPRITVPLKGYLLPNGLSRMPRRNGGAPASDHCASFQAHLAASASAPGGVGLARGQFLGVKWSLPFFFK